MSDERRWLVWSHQHGAWWKSGGWGYTENLEEAGRFTVREATDICVKSSYGWLRGDAEPGERVVSPLPPQVRILAPQFTPTGPHERAVQDDPEVMHRIAARRVKSATDAAVRGKESLGFAPRGGDHF